MINLKENLRQLNELVARFEYEKAHDLFYHDDLIKHENEDAPSIGLERHREEMKVFLSKISNRSATLLNEMLADNISVSVWHYQFDHVEWGRRDFREVSIQRWRDGKIIHERHLYKTEKW